MLSTFYNIVLVATVDQVRHPTFGVAVEPFSEYDADLTIESSDVRVAHGTLIDFEGAPGLFDDLDRRLREILR